MNNIFSAVALVGFVTQVMSLQSAAFAQTARDSIFSRNYSARVGFVPPAESGTPRNTRSAGSRYWCRGTAVMPEDGLGLTTQEQPALYVYVHEDSAKEAMLIVESADGSKQYNEMVSLPEDGKVNRVDFPDTIPGLEVGERYTWSLIMMCNGSLRPDSPTLRGEIKRTESMLTAAQLDTTPLAEQADIYSETGIWYDMLLTMEKMRAENPADAGLVSDWAAQLQSVGLTDEVAMAPLAASMATAARE